MTKELHIAAQYLAAAGISFLEKQNDDSHTNLGWDPNTKSIISRELREDGLHMALSYKDFSIELRLKDRVLAKIPLSQTRHRDNIKWLAEVFRDLLFEKDYKYEIHYELPYEDLDENYTFPYRDIESLEEFAKVRNTAHTVLSELSLTHNEPSEVRIWPHHFDTGTLLWLNDMESIGLGLSISDNMVKEYYFYASAWKGHEMMDTSEFNKLQNGEWLKDSWKGAILTAKDRSNDQVMSFYEEVLNTYQVYSEDVA